jgi:RNA polymerase sigma-70 factor, ECF subfamily
MSNPGPSETFRLLERWHGGDRGGLEQLLERDRAFVLDYVKNRVGDLLLQKAEPDDYVQEAMVQALEYTPPFLISDRDQFRGLIARITENILCDHVVAHNRAKRDVRRERPVPSDSNLLDLDPPRHEVTRPSAAAQRDEDQAWIRLGLELLPRDDRRLVKLREWEGLSFAEIGEHLGITEAAAQMRFQRVLPKLAKQVMRLRSGGLRDVMRQSES